jgi:hypothetical protein
VSEPAEVIEPGTVETVRVEAVLRRDVYRRALPDPFPDLDPEALGRFPDLGDLWP